MNTGLGLLRVRLGYTFGAEDDRLGKGGVLVHRVAIVHTIPLFYLKVVRRRNETFHG